MRGPPGEQTSGSLLYCEHYITAFVHLRNSFLHICTSGLHYRNTVAIIHVTCQTGLVSGNRAHMPRSIRAC
eukprot:COSAG02_NODE_2351_length_9081_cov_101.624137_10_plen_71_part_00